METRVTSLLLHACHKHFPPEVADTAAERVALNSFTGVEKSASTGQVPLSAIISNEDWTSLSDSHYCYDQPRRSKKITVLHHSLSVKYPWEHLNVEAYRQVDAASVDICIPSNLLAW